MRYDSRGVQFLPLRLIKMYNRELRQALSVVRGGSAIMEVRPFQSVQKMDLIEHYLLTYLLRENDDGVRR